MVLQRNEVGSQMVPGLFYNNGHFIVVQDIANNILKYTFNVFNMADN